MSSKDAGMPPRTPHEEEHEDLTRVGPTAPAATRSLTAERTPSAVVAAERPEVGEWTVWASYVLGGWRQQGMGAEKLLLAVAQGLEASPVADVIVQAGTHEQSGADRECVALQERAEKAEAERDHWRQVHQEVGAVMWEALDLIRSRVGGFEQWPEALKEKFSTAIIDRRPLTDSEIAHAQTVAKEYGWLLEERKGKVPS